MIFPSRSILLVCLSLVLCVFGLVHEPRGVSAGPSPQPSDIDFNAFQKSVGLISTNVAALLVLSDLDVSKVITVPISALLTNTNIVAFNDLVKINSIQIDFLQDVVSNNLNKNVIIVKNVLNGNQVEINKLLSINVVAPFVICWHY
jgi:hypothetical protein